MKVNRIQKILDHDKFVGLTSMQTFLAVLDGPAWIFFPGKTRATCRVITTLLHGNEPSGCHAIFRLIKEGFIPVVDTWVLIASVHTSLTPPLFSQRALSGNQDLNRCFRSPWQTGIEKLAERILIDIREFNPEAVIDVHNTSGAGPGFCVATKHCQPIEALAGLFSNSLVISNIKLGALMEVELNCPILTVECGGNQSELSNLFAYRGISKFLTVEKLSTIAISQDLQFYIHPLRLEIKKGFRLAYGDQFQADSDVTLCHSIEQQNFGTTAPQKILGWVGDKGLQSLQIIDATEQNLIEDYFVADNGKLSTTIPLHLFMVTKNRLIAESDCMFYLSPVAAP